MMKYSKLLPGQYMIGLLLISCTLISITTGQSNYASHANNIEYQGKGLPEEATLDGKVTKLDDLSPIIFLNRTKAALNCAAGSMQIALKFDQPFFGIAYADFDRNSACQILGKGDLSYQLELPLKGCGTIQEPQRVFTNNIVVRFHPGLEMDGDEIITIVCRYPPPIPSVPAAIPLINKLITTPFVEPPLKGFQILLIICAIMFLTLMLLGLGVSYYCLRRRPIPVVRRLPMSMGTGSEITKISGSSMGNISTFEGLKIPRAHPPVAVVHSSSGSEEIVISDTIPSDYPSESHSEIEELDTRSLPFSSAASFENAAYIPDAQSIYSEHYLHTQELQAANPVTTTAIPIAAKESSPKFNVHVRVKHAAPPPPPSPLTSDTESVITNVPRNNLSTIVETLEDRESIITVDSLPPHEVAHTQFTYVPEIHPVPVREPPAPAPPQPVFSVYTRTHREIEERPPETWSEDYPDAAPISETRSLVSLGTEMTDTHSLSEMVDTTHYYETQRLPEPPIVVKSPIVSQHNVDDVFLRTITEKKTIEDIETHKRRITEYKAKLPPPDPTWDVTIRNYPEKPGPQWEDFSDISSASGISLTPKMERSVLSLPPRDQIVDKSKKLLSPELVVNMKPIEIPPEDTTVPNWDVLIRVLEDPDMPQPDDTSSVHSSSHPLTRQISYEDKTKWKEIITTESTLRTMLTEAVVREDFERIRKDTRYESIFEPQTWDVIIRILAPTDDDIEFRLPKRNGRKQPWDTRSRRSSLPTLYEYDSDGGSSVRTIRQDPIQPITSIGYPVSNRSRRTSRTSSYGPDNVDFRSMSEVTVDFGRPDNMSEASSYYRPQSGYFDSEPGYDRRSFHRSISHPSLARSGSEFTEHWIAADNISDISSNDEGSPRQSRRLMPFNQRRIPPPPPPRPGRGTTITRSEYHEERLNTYQSQERTHPRDSSQQW
ncbi:uncharacterized protein LOC129611318 [Condylostylus longicornis]|uniref:uncharacterized protein LOC129611318 n=1 Tax=Condylostylus longicornis TaxID=2530218 RepID=UPI00244DEA32|nr:uncharacterized protein LOC129611318 [Condylostylus longicornis]XP_055380376.1 uncharacterized protein LOC129611318 [Condylostylus longicornis]